MLEEIPMHIGVLFIAAAFQVRVKLEGRDLLMQEEKQKMRDLLDELVLWGHNSREQITPIILTCYDEIYEIAVQRHLKVYRNDFAKAAEGSMIRFGLEKLPDCDAYMILSASDLTLFRAEIFESLCIHFKKNPDKIIMAKYEDHPCLPLVFSKQSADAVNLAVSRNEGKFVLRLNSRNSGYLTVTKELLETTVYDRNGKASKEKNIDGHKSPMKTPDELLRSIDTRAQEKIPVVIIRGAGRIASSTAILLKEAGFAVLLTEKQKPETIFRANTFSSAVDEGKKKLSGTESYLVTLSRRNLAMAWKAGVIPLAIDPDFSCLKMFDGIAVTEQNLFDPETSSNEFDPLKKYREDELYNSEPEPEPEPESYNPLSGYELFAVCDLTSPNQNKPTLRNFAAITLGIYEHYQYEEGPKMLIHTEFGLDYSKIVFHSPYKVVRIPSESEVTEKESVKAVGQRIHGNTLEQDPLFHHIRAPIEGIYREIRTVPDTVSKGEIIGQIDSITGDTEDVPSPFTGRIVGSRKHGSVCLPGSSLAAISDTEIDRERCFETFPVDFALGASILRHLNESKHNFG
jgi:molybdopterin-guanine dinucleotide biosynthesis protein A